MKQTLEVLNQLEREGVIGRYAIGGAIAATRYIEPIQTYDLDVFVLLPVSPSGLISLSPIYDRLREYGYTPRGEAVEIAGWPVQFLPVYNPLTEAALQASLEVEFAGAPTRVLSAEYLAAIMLETGRPKDHARLMQFFECAVVNRTVLEDLIARHGLAAKWTRFKSLFLEEKE